MIRIGFNCCPEGQSTVVERLTIITLSLASKVDKVVDSESVVIQKYDQFDMKGYQLW